MQLIKSLFLCIYMNRLLEGKNFLISIDEDGKDTDTPVAKKDKSVTENGKNGNGRINKIIGNNETHCAYFRLFWRLLS